MAGRNPYEHCNDDNDNDDQEKDQDGDEYRSRNTSYGFLHDNQVQEGAPRIHLTLTISEALIRKLKFALTQKKQHHSNNINHQQQQVMLSQPQQPSLKSKASNLPAKFFRVGSWNWESKNPGDLVVKFYYGKKQMVWEFLSGSLKKKIEIHWNQVSAIKDYVDEKKNGRLEIELGDPPEYYQECKFQPQKHTQWEKTNDFTQGQAPSCRRHTIIFSPGVLDEPLKTLLQYDNRLYNLHRQPFPFHNSHFFEPKFQNSYNNISVGECSMVPRSNDHVQNHVQPTNSFVGHSGSNVPMPGFQMFPDSYEGSREDSYVNEITNGVLDQTGNNQIQDIHLAPVREQDPFEGLEPIISDEQLELHHVDNQNLAEVTTQQHCFKVDSTIEQNHQNIFDPFVARTDVLCSNGGVINDHHMAFLDEDRDDEDVCRFAQLQFDNEFTIPEPCFWSSSQDSMHGSNNGGNGGSST